jgi:hypothetical protein
MAYMDFLNVSKEALPDEFNSTDFHQYIFDLEKSRYVMNHTIPASNFSLLFNSSLAWEWEDNPYPAPTPSGFDPNISSNFSTWRNKIDKGPGKKPFKVDEDAPDGTSCYALKSQLWQPRNETLPNGTIHTVMYVNTFWRELVSPTLAKFTLVIADENFMPIEPWKSQGYSYRWFRRTVQSFEDVPLRLPCKPSGIEGDEFC